MRTALEEMSTRHVRVRLLSFPPRPPTSPNQLPRFFAAATFSFRDSPLPLFAPLLCLSSHLPLCPHSLPLPPPPLFPTLHGHGPPIQRA